MFITAAPWLEACDAAGPDRAGEAAAGELAYGTNGPGRLTDLTGELLQSRARHKAPDYALGLAARRRYSMT